MQLDISGKLITGMSLYP